MRFSWASLRYRRDVSIFCDWRDLFGDSSILSRLMHDTMAAGDADGVVGECCPDSISSIDEAHPYPSLRTIARDQLSSATRGRHDDNQQDICCSNAYRVWCYIISPRESTTNG